MKLSKTALCFAAACMILSSLAAQEEKRSEVTVEEEYFGSNEDMIISEMSQVDDYETKLLTLQYIKTALDAGRSSPAIEASLQNMAGEGVFNESRTGRRQTNNYTEVRRKRALCSVKQAVFPTNSLKRAKIRLCACCVTKENRWCFRLQFMRWAISALTTMTM